MAAPKINKVVQFPPPVGFDEVKAAQVACFFAAENNEPIDKLALIKLIYLSEREFVSRHGHPMLMDELYSLKHGPICSSSLNGINGNLSEDIWPKYVSLDGNSVSAVGDATRQNLDHVSDAEIDVLKQIWESFGFMTAAQLRKYTHLNCPEYTEVENGRIAISYRKLFEALGFDDANAYEDLVLDMRKADNLL